VSSIPPGPPPGPPGPPPGLQSPPTRRRPIPPAQVVALGLAFLLLCGAIVAAVATQDSEEGSAASDTEREVFTEPVSSTRNPFSPPVGNDYPDMPRVRTQGFSTEVGGQPGLYGGTMSHASCNAEQLVTYLQANSDKASAWASTIGIQVSEIATYVDSLTAVLLRSDTRVTNHGFTNGRATSIQTVLQAGTAVLVDDKGQPVTKCYCGNPLTPPVAYPRVYYGPKWHDFDPSSLTVVVQNTTVINIFTLVDPATGTTFTRPAGAAGSDGAQDAPVDPNAPAPQPPTPPQSPASTRDDRRALAKFERLAGTCFPFPGIEQDVSEERTTSAGPDDSSLIVKVVGTTAGGTTQTFTWQVDRETLVFTPLDELARLVSLDCAALGSPE
jgi:hypothetical protein